MNYVSSHLNKLPIIDLSKEDLIPGSIIWKNVRDEVVGALEEYGCFEAVYNNEITEELHDRVFKGLAELYDLPSETKSRFKDPANTYYGYLPKCPLTPLYERMGIPATFDAVRKLTDLMWPDGNPRFCDALCSYIEGLHSLDSIVKRMVFEGLKVEKHLDSYMKLASRCLRLMKYSVPLSHEEKAEGISHYDVSFITIVQQNHVNGLEVKLHDGKWIKATPSSSSFIIMIGEALQGWSNGRLQCPKHRVISGNEVRYSIGYFSSINGTVQAPEELINDQHPLLYKPFDEDGLARIFQRVDMETRETGSALDTYYKM